MNKQMTPAQIELVQQSFARFAPISDKAALVSPPPRVVAEHQASSGVIATPLRVPSVRQAPRSCSNRTGSMPRPAIAKLASSLTSMPSRSSASCRNCSPAARSASDRRRSSRPVAVMPAGVRCVKRRQQQAAAHVELAGAEKHFALARQQRLSENQSPFFDTGHDQYSFYRDHCMRDLCRRHAGPCRH